MNKLLFITTLIFTINTSTDLMAEAVLVTYLNLPDQEAFDSLEKESPSGGGNPVSEFQKTLTVGGFLALYSGYYTYSAHDGEISFPLRHTTPKTYLVVTPKINLLKIKGETINYPELGLVDGAPAKIYMYEKVEPEVKPPLKKEAPYWRVTEAPIPPDKKINPVSIVLLTNPSNIYLKLKDYREEDTPQSQIPGPKVVGVADNDKVAIEMLDMLKYFEPIQRPEQKVDDLKTKSIFENSKVNHRPCEQIRLLDTLLS